ncbi:pilus assembly protein [Arthrobacter sp. M4]|nr:pilus assembly protein [Arthrobacter sp. M4]
MRYRQNNRGTVTAEFAVALPAVIFLLALLLAGSAAGITQLRIEEAARAGARSLARGDSAATVQGTVSRLAGDGALSTVDADGDWLKVTVTAPVGGPLGKLIPWTLTASASSRTELPVSAYGHLAEVRAEGLRRKDSA